MQPEHFALVNEACVHIWKRALHGVVVRGGRHGGENYELDTFDNGEGKDRSIASNVCMWQYNTRSCRMQIHRHTRHTDTHNDTDTQTQTHTHTHIQLERLPTASTERSTTVITERLATVFKQLERTWLREKMATGTDT